jgi:hypothetical protein
VETAVRVLVENSAGMRSSRGQDPCWHGLIEQHPWKEGVVSRHVYQRLPDGQATFGQKDESFSHASGPAPAPKLAG